MLVILKRWFTKHLTAPSTSCIYWGCKEACLVYKKRQDEEGGWIRKTERKRDAMGNKANTDAQKKAKRKKTKKYWDVQEAVTDPLWLQMSACFLSKMFLFCPNQMNGDHVLEFDAILHPLFWNTSEERLPMFHNIFTVKELEPKFTFDSHIHKMHSLKEWLKPYPGTKL